jgi:tryptophanyl-tRNA synthetase
MSKSLDNAIFLNDSPAEVRRKVRGMFTDPSRIRADIPGRVEGNPVFIYHRAFNRHRAEVDDLEVRYRQGRVGDVEVKEKLSVALNELLEPMRERRAVFERPGYVERLILDGTERTREEVKRTLREMRKAMGITDVWNRMRRKTESREP